MANGSGKSYRRALVLAGGGARGAYEVGVLKYVFTELSAKEGLTPRFDIISGTSVGAINGCYLASQSGRPDYNIAGLERLWTDLRIKNWLHLHYREIFEVLKGVAGFGRVQWGKRRRPFSGGRLGGLLNTGAFDQIVRGALDRNPITQNVRDGHLEAVTVTATEIGTGRTVCFIESSEPLPPWSQDKTRIAKKVDIGAQHALASAALPFLFPAVSIDGAYYCDGSLRQPTPLSPALRLGADRVLVVALRYGGEKDPAERQAAVSSYPNAVFLFGKLLNALLLDPVGYDLEVLERINRILIHGRQVYGPRFEEDLSTAVTPLRGKPYRIIDDILVRPSEDLGRVAHRVGSTFSRSDRGRGPAAPLFQRSVKDEPTAESDFLSYLLFVGAFCHVLIEMGVRDAATHHDDLVAFFSDERIEYE